MELPLGADRLSFDPPAGSDVQTIARGPGDPARSSAALPPLVPAIDRLCSELAFPSGAQVLVLVPDRTRAFPLATALPALVSGLLARGAAPRDVTVFLASGTHAHAPEDDAPERLGALPRGVRVTRNDPDRSDALAGTTPAGTEVRVAPALLEADLVVALGGIAFHYFAGYGGAWKMLFPGAGARASIAANHARSLGPWPPGGLAPGVGPGRVRGNPVAEDLAAAAALLPQARHVTALPDATGAWRALVWSEPGAYDEACARYAEGRRTGARHAHDLVCAAAGGAPRDLDVVQAHKALHHAALYARDGAELVFAAACDEGAGSAPFARWLEAPDRVALEAEARARYDLNAQTAISLVAIAQRLRVTWIARRPLPGVERWGVRVVGPRDAGRVLGEAFARARGGRAAWLEAASDVVPRDLPPAH